MVQMSVGSTGYVVLSQNESDLIKRIRGRRVEADPRRRCCPGGTKWLPKTDRMRSGWEGVIQKVAILLNYEARSKDHENTCELDALQYALAKE